MSTQTVTKRYYSKLSDVMTVDDLPEFLSFVEDGLDTLLDNIYYKNFQYSKSVRGDSAFYSLEIISNNVGLDLPFGLRLVLDPDSSGDSSISSFPVTVQYQWQLLAFLSSFNLQGFSFAPEAFYNLGLQIFRVSDDQVFANTLKYFITPVTTDINKFQQLVNDINLFYPSANLTLPTGSEPTITSVMALIKQNANIPVSISELMFLLYLLDVCFYRQVQYVVP